MCCQELHLSIMTSIIENILYCFLTMVYSEEQKLAIVRLFYSNNNDVATVQREYRRLYPYQSVPCRMTVQYIIQKFAETKSLKRKKRTVERNENEDLDILLFYQGISFLVYFFY